MVPRDFINYKILNFSLDEVTGTGAKLSDVKLLLFIKLQSFRIDFNRVMVLLPNGLTSGNHNAFEHPGGIAVDWTVREKDGTINVSHIVNLARKHGFAGIGIYHNSIAYSFHFHVGNRYAQWIGYKKHREEQWNYASLINDPKSFTGA